MSTANVNPLEYGGLGEINPRLLGSEMKLLRASARWGMSPEMRQKCIRRLSEALDMADSARDIAAVVKTAAVIEGQDQKDEHAAAGLLGHNQTNVVNVIGESPAADLRRRVDRLIAESQAGGAVSGGQVEERGTSQPDASK